MKYIWKNIKTFFRQEKGIFLLSLLCIFLSLYVILIAYGVFGYYLNQKNNMNEQMKAMEIGLSEYEGKGVTKQLFVNTLNKCSEELLDKTRTIYVEVDDPNVPHFEFRFCIRNGKISVCQLFRDNLKMNGFSDSYFTEEEENKGDTVALVNPKEYEDKKINDHIEILGKYYTIIGYQTWNTVIIPFESLSDNVTLSEKSGIYLEFSDIITRNEYDELKEVFTREMGNFVKFPEMNIPDFNQIYFYNTILIVNGLIACVAAINFALLYKFILMKRSSNLAILQMIGLTKVRAVFIYIGECIFLLVGMILASIISFHYIIIGGLKRIYPNFEGYYTVGIYVRFGIGYLCISLITLGIVILKEIYGKQLLDRIKVKV